MRLALSLLVVLTFTTISISVGQKPDGFANSPPQAYELYSWQQSGGIWSFCVLPSPSGVNTPAEAVFNKKFLLTGVDELKRKISELPAGAKIFWMDRIVPGKNPKPSGSKMLAYPPAKIIEQVNNTLRRAA